MFKTEEGDLDGLTLSEYVKKRKENEVGQEEGPY